MLQNSYYVTQLSEELANGRGEISPCIHFVFRNKEVSEY